MAQSLALQPQSQQGPNFLGLPLEIRTLIYEFLGLKDANYSIEICSRGICSVDSGVLSDILHVNKQIQSEVAKNMKVKRLEVHINRTDCSWIQPLSIPVAWEAEIESMVVYEPGHRVFDSEYRKPPIRTYNALRNIIVRLPNLQRLSIDEFISLARIQNPGSSTAEEVDATTLFDGAYVIPYQLAEQRLAEMMKQLGLTLYGFDRIGCSLNKLLESRSTVILDAKLHFQRTTTVSDSQRKTARKGNEVYLEVYDHSELNPELSADSVSSQYLQDRDESIAC